MNIEFHYYALRYLARCAGFPESESAEIAISSQLVDECLAPWEIAGARGGAATHTEVTQNYLFWDEGVAAGIYRPFHFIPGVRDAASARRADGAASPGAVTPDSPLAREVLIAALRTKNLARIGIALHAYADSWAHQGFSADIEPQNALDPASPLPAVGHLQAFGAPDDPRRRWVDPRLAEGEREVDNAGRFAGAAGMIYRFLCAFRRKGFSDEAFVVERLAELWRRPAPPGDSAARASDYIIDLDLPPYEPEAWAREAGGTIAGLSARGPDPFAAGYNRLAWLKGAAMKASAAAGAARGWIPAERYRGSRFERWNEAAREHRAFCLSLFKERGSV
ncbi:hypothetical protein LWX53_06160 [bacterium]|nr:hypothetical protein [bacterium]